jgi:Lrp/AsnC family leucine-responsive transcriptional regulator
MPNNKIDTIDLRIFHELQQCGKISKVDLAGRVGLSPSPCLSRVRAIEQKGIIDRYVALVKPDRLSDIKTLEAFIVQKLSTIDGVLNIQSSFALKQVKYKTELPINSG